MSIQDEDIVAEYEELAAAHGGEYIVPEDEPDAEEDDLDEKEDEKAEDEED